MAGASGVVDRKATMITMVVTEVVEAIEVDHHPHIIADVDTNALVLVHILHVDIKRLRWRLGLLMDFLLFITLFPYIGWQ